MNVEWQTPDAAEKEISAHCASGGLVLVFAADRRFGVFNSFTRAKAWVDSLDSEDVFFSMCQLNEPDWREFPRITH